MSTDPSALTAEEQAARVRLLTGRIDPPGRKADALAVSYAVERLAQENAEARGAGNELRDILQTTAPTWVAILTSARELRSLMADWKARHDQVILDAAKTCEQALQAQMQAEAKAEMLARERDSLRLELDAARHCQRKDNEYLLSKEEHMEKLARELAQALKNADDTVREGPFRAARKAYLWYSFAPQEMSDGAIAPNPLLARPEVQALLKD